MRAEPSGLAPSAVTAPLLTLVTNGASASMPLPELAREAVDGGVDLVQVREPGQDPRTLYALVAAVVHAVGQQRVAVNNAPTVAARLGIRLHLPERAPAGYERLEAPAGLSCSVHSVESLARVPSEADHVIAGHLFPTSSHPGVPPLGVDGLRNIVTASSQPVVAIGGISSENAGRALGAGAVGVAVMSYVNSSHSPKKAARALRDVLERTMAQQAAAISVVVNGKPMALDSETTLTTFLEQRNLHPRLVVVERNGEIVAKSAYDSIVLDEGDLLEIAHFVGGG